MTGDALRKLQAGDRLTSIPASAWNAFIDAAEYVRARLATGGVPGNSVPLSAGQILVLNASGADRDWYDVLELDAPVIGPDVDQSEFRSRVAMSGVTPTADGIGSFVVLAEPVASGQIGRAWIDGVCAAWISGEGEFADTKDGEAGYLQADGAGAARILWSESGSAERWAIIRLADTSAIRWGVANADADAWADVEVSIYAGTPPTGTDTTRDVTCINAGVEVFEGTLGLIVAMPCFSSHKWLFSPLECPTA